MKGHETNPFQELYVTDSADPTVFVRLFSDLPVQHSQPLFRKGNVVIKGTEGSGKSMLLNLFRPQIRLAYSKTNEDFPVPEELRQFIGGGINLRRSGALNIGQRHLGGQTLEDQAQFPLYFSDFVNYYIVRDILGTLEIMSKNPSPFGSIVDKSKLNQFAKALSSDDCWFQGIAPSNSFDELCSRLDERIQGYLRYHNYNGELPTRVHESKTSIGDPIDKTGEHLKAVGVVPEETPIFVSIDQIESLHRSDSPNPTLGRLYRRVINKALSTRDIQVSYRVGTRQYAWEDELEIFGREDRLENKRDFEIIDLDDMLRRKEDTKTWIFPQFVEDAFARRLDLAGYELDNRKANLVSRVFGRTTDASDAARQYCRTSPAERILKLNDMWPDRWKSYLTKLYEADPLEAALAAAWARQSSGRRQRGNRVDEPPPKEDRPWRKAWWKKERIRQCQMQIAARSSQRLKWAGKDQVIGLSSGNIYVFLSICHDVWKAHLRSERKKSDKERLDPIRHKKPIHYDVQSVGIQTASDIWYEKVSGLPNGDDRQAFIAELGKTFRGWLLNDDAMSYPGHNGFSIANDQLRSFPALAEFLEDAVRHGDLHEAPHTTKQEDRRKRTKWYLSPILSPHFQIPETHVKEPRYINDFHEIAQWLRNAGIVRDELQEFLTAFPSTRSRDGSAIKNDHPSQEQFDFGENAEE